MFVLTYPVTAGRDPTTCREYIHQVQIAKMSDALAMVHVLVCSRRRFTLTWWPDEMSQ